MREFPGRIVPWACLAVLAVAGCSPPQRQIAPPVSLPGRFSAGGRSELPLHWWTAFGSERLNLLNERALRQNFSLAAAWDRLSQAQAAATRAGAPLWPSLDGSTGARRSVTHMDTGPTAGTTYQTTLSLGLVASYEVDLWGRIRAGRKAATLEAAASEADLRAAAITVTAEVARAWFRLIEQRQQLRLLTEQVATNEKFLEVIELRFRRGQVSATDVLQQRELVEQTRGQRPLVESSISILRNQLAILTGQAPGRADLPPADNLPALPALPRTGVPAEWVRRRPDVRAAELRAAAQDHRVWAAVADQFPRLSLSAEASTSAEELRNLFDNWAASLAANLMAPLFDAGLRRAEIQRNRAALSERLNTYASVVLNSLGEVENALLSEARQEDYLNSLARQLELSRRAAERTREQYIKGRTDFTRYLTTLLSYQRLERTELQARRDLLLLRVDLYRALAGGWDLPRPQPATPADPPADAHTPPPAADRPELAVEPTAPSGGESPTTRRTDNAL